MVADIADAYGEGTKPLIQLSTADKPTRGIQYGRELIESDTGYRWVFALSGWIRAGQHVKDAVLVPTGFDQLSPITSATGLTVPAGSRVALIQADTQDARWRDDGTSPTASVGMLLSTDDVGLWYNGDLEAIEFIEVVSGAIVNVSFYY